MAIHFKCPNGHSLSTKESNAGKTGKCPKCQSAFEVPKQTVLTESAVLDIIGDPEPTTSVHAITESLFSAIDTQDKPPTTANKSKVAPASAAASSKTCDNCERDIDSRYQICPFCKTYLADKR